jgi:hypothetical protein
VGQKAKWKGSTHAGYFERGETKAITNALRQVDGNAGPVYCTLNRVNPALLSRAVNRLQAGLKNTTADQDIIERRWLYSYISTWIRLGQPVSRPPTPSTPRRSIAQRASHSFLVIKGGQNH